MENYYQLYLDSAQMYALGYWLLFATSVVVPLLILLALVRRGKFGNDGLPVDSSSTTGAIVYCVAQIFGIIVAVNSIINAIPATFTPALWALSKVTGCE